MAGPGFASTFSAMRKPALCWIPLHHRHPWLLLALIVAGCGTEPDSSGPIRFLSGGRLTDTAAAEPAEPLTVRIAGVEEGTRVEFEGVEPAQGGERTYVRRLTDPFFLPELVGYTDSLGRISLRLRLGTRVGDTYVRIRVPTTGAVDSARYTVRPGASHHLSAAPSYQAVLLGETYQLQVVVEDQHGNPRPGDPVQLTNPDGRVSFTGLTVRGVQTGLAIINIQSGPATGTVGAAVVPDLALTQVSGLGVNIIRADGKSIKLIQWAMGLRDPARWSWRRNGSMVALDGEGLYTLDRQGNAKQLTDGSEAVAYPHFSADEAWIFYSRQRPDGTWHLRRIRTDGTEDQLVLDGDQLHWPAPSPDGRYLAYSDGGSLWLHDLVEGGSELLATPGDSPVWSSSGDDIAFIGTGLQFIRPDGSDLRTLPGVDWYPGIDWSPDGKWIIGSSYSGTVMVDVTSGAAMSLPFTAHWFVPPLTP